MATNSAEKYDDWEEDADLETSLLESLIGSIGMCWTLMF